MQSSSSRGLVDTGTNTNSSNSEDLNNEYEMTNESEKEADLSASVDNSIQPENVVFNNGGDDDDDDEEGYESGSLPEFTRSPSKRLSAAFQKVSSLARVASVMKVKSLRKAMSFYDIEANFHGDKQTLYDPDIKYAKLGELFWRLDFKPSSFKRWSLYRDNIKFMLGLLIEVVLVAGTGLLFLWGLSSIPFTTDGRMYYDKYMIALYYFITMFTLFLVIAYGFFVMIYGFKESKPLVFYTVIPGCIISVLPFIFVAAGVEPWFYFLDLLFFVFVGVLFNTSAIIMAKQVIGKEDKENSKALFLAYTTPLTLHAVVIAIYYFVIIPFYRNLDSDFLRAIFRMIVHPVVTQINMTVATFFCKKYPRVKHQHLTTGVVFGIWVESSMFGRFLIATVGSVKSQLATSAAVGVVDIIIRLLSLKREHLSNYFQKRFLGIEKLNYNEAKERAFMGQFNNNAMVVEHVSILVVPFLLYSFYKHRFAFNLSYSSVEPSITTLYQSAAVQFGIQLVVHFVCCVFEYCMKVPNILVWKQKRRVYLVWEMANFVQILALIVFVFKTLPSVFFCDSVDPCSCSKNSYFDLNLFFNDPHNYCAQ